MTLLDRMGETGESNQIDDQNGFQESHDNAEDPQVEDPGGFELVDYSLPQRDVPVVHSAVDPVICESCAQGDPPMFDPNCEACLEILQSPSTTIPELYAVLRQWNPAPQRNIDLIISEVGYALMIKRLDQ